MENNSSSIEFIETDHQKFVAMKDGIFEAIQFTINYQIITHDVLFQAIELHKAKFGISPNILEIGDFKDKDFLKELNNFASKLKLEVRLTNEEVFEGEVYVYIFHANEDDDDISQNYMELNFRYSDNYLKPLGTRKMDVNRQDSIIAIKDYKKE